MAPVDNQEKSTICTRNFDQEDLVVVRERVEVVRVLLRVAAHHVCPVLADLLHRRLVEGAPERDLVVRLPERVELELVRVLEDAQPRPEGVAEAGPAQHLGLLT